MNTHPAEQIKLIECPRDAMQGWPSFIPTSKKIEYLNALLKVGFDTLDCGSFVSPKAIPQMADTKEVLSQLKLENTKTRLLVIVANKRGAEEALQLEQVSYLGFPLSVSETFQMLNTNSTIPESLNRITDIKELCEKKSRKLVVYISMGFGNPYGDEYNTPVLLKWIDAIIKMDIQTVSLADTVGLASPDLIRSVVETVVQKWPANEIGVHLHSTTQLFKEKLQAALLAGCYRFDGALKGVGGCPMANNPLVGNMNTENMVGYFDELNFPFQLNMNELANCLKLAENIFVNNNDGQ